eukprot:24768_1
MSNVSKYVFGKNTLGRMKRTVKCDSTTYDGIQWIPNFNGSQRGAVLKTTNKVLLSHGIKKRSQVDSINGKDISNLPFKKILKILNECVKLSKPFSTSFMIPEQNINTIEVSFRGKFCDDYIKFACDENDRNFIISSIDCNNEDAQILIKKSNIKVGYRVSKVKSINVINKKYTDILKLIKRASNDLRIEYSILFEEGELDWYNTKTPTLSKSKISKPTNIKHVKTQSLNFTSKYTKNLKQRSFDNGKNDEKKDLAKQMSLLQQQMEILTKQLQK